MKKKVCSIWAIIVLFIYSFNCYAQQGESMYGEAAKADVKMNYVYSLEEAFKQAREQNKPIFFNCFADWAVPCHAMNKLVFSNQELCDYMDKNFVNLFIDVTKPEAASVKKKYNAITFAQYLILDADGNVLLRIMGGKEIGEFKEAVARGLSPKTSLAGTEKVYQSGKYGKKELLNYLYALNLAADREQFDKVAAEYISMLKEKEYVKKENWIVIRSLITDCNSDLFNFLVTNRKEFIKENGEATIVGFIESVYYRGIFDYALGNLPYDAVKLADLYNGMQKVGLPETSIGYKIYHIAQLRGQQKYDELLSYTKEQGKALEDAKFFLDCSFDFPDMTDAMKAKVTAYWREAAKEEEGSKARRLEQLAREKEDKGGIKFEIGTFAEAMAKAKSEKKLVFLDCYTSWCGPCKMMSSQVFVIPEVGEYFNNHFVNIKIDMEKGEGRDLAKKYRITAYPTMMLLDENGEIVQKILGARDAAKLMEAVSEVTDPKDGYSASKAAYERGERTGTVIKNYIRTMKQAGELKDSDMEKMVMDFFAKLTDDQFCQAVNWPLIDLAVDDVKSENFARILKLHDQLANQNGIEVVNKKIEKVVFPFILKCFNFEVSEKEALSVLTPIYSGHYPKDYTLRVLAELVPMFQKDKVDNVLDFYEQRVAEMQNQADRLNIEVLLYRFLEKATAEQLVRARQYVEKAIQRSDSRATRSYKILMQKLDAIQA